MRLVSAVDAVGDLSELRLGLEVVLKPGWKTYWRSPGDGGLPPNFDWGGSRNLGEAVVGWPAPERFEILGIDSVGYETAVTFPIRIALKKPGEPLVANLSIDFLTCETLCVPQRADLTLELPAGVSGPSEEAFSLSQAQGKVPGPTMPGFSVAKAEIVAGEGARWWLKLVTSAALANADAFVESPDSAFVFGRPERLGPTVMRLPVLYANSDPASLVSQPLTVTLTDGGRAVEDNVIVAPASRTSSDGLAWLLILATAFAGGLILNLMPCVLPVLSIKLSSVIRHGGGDLSGARASFLATVAGIVTSFGLLAAAVIGLKAAGIAVGWGMQFQAPTFIILMAMVSVLFAANLWGIFEVPLPAAVGRLGTGQAGAFFTGFFATLMATPCSAPFVGTALAFALSQGWVETLSIFLAMGLGLSVPYLAIAVRPQLATALPKPGRWMIWVRAVLGIALAATAVWLGSILWALAGQTATLGLAIVAGALLVWLALPARRLRMPVAGVLIAASLALPSILPLQSPAAKSKAAAENAVWMTFSQDYLADLVANGRTVLVDVTADWCITCQANKAAVLDRGEVMKMLQNDVVGLRADWTKPDPAIQAYLASFGRYGIPFNAVYGPGAPGGIALPEILTERAVLEAFEQAAAEQQ